MVSATSAPMRGGFRRRAGRRALGGGREAVAQARRCDARGGEELLVIEGDDLRAALGLQIAFEIGRHIDGADGLAGAYRARRRCEVAGALDDAETRGRRDLLHECARGLGSVLVDDDHPQSADHRMTEHRGQHHEGEQRHAEDQDQRRTIVQQPPPFAPGDQQEAGFRRCRLIARAPIQIGAHAGAQLRHLVDRIGSDRERPQVEIAGGAGGAPARIFAFGRDQFDLDSDAAVGQRGNAHVEAVADLQRLDQILTQIKVDPQVVEIDQGHQRHAGRDIFAGLHVALVDLRGHRRVDHHLIDDRLHGLDVGERLADIGRRDSTFLLGIAIDRLLVGRSRLIDGALAFMQGIGRLVEARNRGVAVFGQLADAVIGLLRQHDARLCSLERGLACGDDLGPRADVDIGELRLGHDPGGERLISFGDRLGVVDANEHRAGGDVLTADDRNFPYPPIDAGCNV